MVYSNKYDKCDVGNIEVVNYTKLIRSSYDRGFFGKKSSGKTLAMTYFGYLDYRYNNAIIFSNYEVVHGKNW